MAKKTRPTAFGETVDRIDIKYGDEFPIRVLPELISDEVGNGMTVEDARQVAANINAACDAFDEHSTTDEFNAQA